MRGGSAAPAPSATRCCSNGQRFRIVGVAAEGFSGTTLGLEVVGMTRRTKYFSIGEDPKPYAYFPLAQATSRALPIVACTKDDPGGYLREIGGVVHASNRSCRCTTSRRCPTASPSRWRRPPAGRRRSVPARTDPRDRPDAAPRAAAAPALAPALLIAACTVASWIPACQAVRISAATALRYE